MIILIVSFYQLEQLYYELGQLLLFQIGTKDIANQGSPHFYISGQNYYKSRQLLKIWADLLQMWDAITDRAIVTHLILAIAVILLLLYQVQKSSRAVL